jgi:hypothetical protein
LMAAPILICQDERRCDKARERLVSGIDYVEVSEDQRSLCVHFFGKVPEGIKENNVVIDGGRRIRDIRVLKVEVVHKDDPEPEDCLEVLLDRPGDFSTYTLRLVEAINGRPTDEPLAGLDQRYSRVEFSFKVGCPVDLDCRTGKICPPQERSEPDINYLAKDYASFRQLMLDRLSLIMPGWQERHIPDLGIALVEVLAYAGDHLSYYQDAVSTEAYLDTARQRISVRRHARLVDYRVHEGCNARTWVRISTDADVSLHPGEIYFITGSPELAGLGRSVLEPEDLAGIPPRHYEVFEPLPGDTEKLIDLYAAHNEICFYTWDDELCGLPIGSTQATLRERCEDSGSAPPSGSGRRLHLQEGDILIFEERLGPATGKKEDANPAHRQAVRLTRVELGEDKLYDPPIPVIEIEWSAADALTFPLCISARVSAPDCRLIHDVSVARGNVILVDHGKITDEPELLGRVEGTKIETCVCDGVEFTYLPERFSPALKNVSPTFSQKPVPGAPASTMLIQDPRQAVIQITLTGRPEGVKESDEPADPVDRRWYPVPDLLSSQSQDQHFVVEMDNESRAHLRFGDGELGRMPEANLQFSAIYRTGNGPAGNVGAETISYIVFRNNALPGLQPCNPLPARGGIDPEPLTDVKLFAPYAFKRVLQRAITADDYARIAERNDRVQRASASLSWTGSWYEDQVVIDPLGGEVADEELLLEIAGYLHRYRLMGHDLTVVPARYVPLEIEISVCVRPHYQRAHVKAALLETFSNRLLPDGRRGLFHPDNLTFGQGIHPSLLVTAAQAVAGVQSVVITKLERLFMGPNHEIEDGVLPLGPFEIAQMDNDPSFPERGKLTLILRGGR